MNKAIKGDIHIPMGIGTIAGFVLALSGLFPIAVLALVLWFVLRAIRDGVSIDILFATSIIISASSLGLIFACSHEGSVESILEAFGVLCVGLILFVTENKLWAILQIAHSAWVLLDKLSALKEMNIDHTIQPVILGSVFLNLFILWFLISFLIQRTRQF